MKAKLQDELRRTGTGGMSGNLSDTPTSGADMRGSEGDIARQKAESKLFGLAGSQSERIRQEMARYATMRDPRLR